MQWIKRAFDPAGLTKYPTGPHLAAVQALFGGNVILCLAISGSMAIDNRLPQAIDGCKLFVTEALAAGYSVGCVLWNHSMLASTGGVSRERNDTDCLFSGTRPAGGNDIGRTLKFCEGLLEGGQATSVAPAPQWQSLAGYLTRTSESSPAALATQVPNCSGPSPASLLLRGLPRRMTSPAWPPG